jgi:hypothetical protein
MSIYHLAVHHCDTVVQLQTVAVLLLMLACVGCGGLWGCMHACMYASAHAALLAEQ